MKKRISIQYSIDESNIAHECYRLLDNTLSRLTSIAASTPPTESVVNETTMREIRSLRTELSEIDIELGDVHAIIDGFLDYQHSNKTASQQSKSNNEQNKIDIPDFLSKGPENLDLNQLSSFVEQLKTADPENFNMQKVAELDHATVSNIDPSEIDPVKINEVVESFKKANLEGVDPQQIFDMLGGLHNGATKFDEIGQKLEGLKARIDSGEISD